MQFLIPCRKICGCFCDDDDCIGMQEQRIREASLLPQGVSHHLSDGGIRENLRAGSSG